MIRPSSSSTESRLHFICECGGKHAQAVGSNTPHHLHLAKHEGYLVREPTEFFKKYGPYLLLMLEMIKCGTNVAGHVVPALATLRVVALVDSIQQSIATVSSQIDYSLECIGEQMEKLQASSLECVAETDDRTQMTQHDLAGYLSNVEGLEGVELRQLGSFLKTSEEDNLLGGLYRMITLDGHVKWVCRDHYRAGYQAVHIEKLQDIVKLGSGAFDEQMDKINITLWSSFSAQMFYDTLLGGNGVLELSVSLRWQCTSKDTDALRNALSRTLVSTVYVDLQQYHPGLRSKLSSIPAQYEGVYRLLEPLNLKSIHIVLPQDLLSFPISLQRSQSTFEIYPTR